MALLRWDDEEDKKDESNITRVAAVQDSWQPAPSGANSAVATSDITTRPSGGGVFGQVSNQAQPVQNYLLSDEKAQADEARRQKEAQVAEANRQAAARAALVTQQQQQPQQQLTQPDANKIAREKRIGELRAQLANENKGLGGFLRRNFKDKIDANSTQDRLNRLMSERPETFQDEQKIMARDNVQSVATNPFKRIFEDAVEAPRRVGTALARNSIDGKAADEASLTADRIDKEFIAKAQNKLQDPTVSYEEKLRWQKALEKLAPQIAQDLYDRQIQRDKNTKDDDPAAVAAALAEMGLDVATLGAGGVVIKGGRTAAKAGGKPLLNYLGKNIVKPVLPAAGAGGIGAITSQGSDVTPEQIALGTAAGAGLGLAFPVAGIGLGRLLTPFKTDFAPNVKAVDGALDVNGVPIKPPETTIDAPVPNEGADFVPVDEAAGATDQFSFAREEATPEQAKTTERLGDQTSPANLGNPETPFTSTEADTLIRLEEQRSYGTLSPELEIIRQKLLAKKDTLLTKPEVTPVPAAAPAKVAPAAEGTAQVPILPTEQIKALQDSRAGKTDAEAAAINQKIQELQQATPAIDGENTRLFGENAPAVKYTDGITTEGGDKAVGVTEDGHGVSTIVIDKTAENGEAVFHHEAVHKTLNDFSTPEQRASAIDSYRKHYGIDNKLTDDQVEELVSDDFAKFVASKRSKDAARADMNLPQQVKDYFEQMWQQIQDTYTSLKKNGQLTPEFKKLYNDLNNGKYVDAAVIDKALDPRVKNRYMLGGEKAKTYDPEDKAGRNFVGIEGKPRFEMDDSKAQLTDNFIKEVKDAQGSGRSNGSYKLGDVLNHPKLFEAYPKLKDINVELFYRSPAGGTIHYGGFTPATNTLRLNAHSYTAQEMRATILHEVQHAVQGIEGFAKAYTPAQRKQFGRGQPPPPNYFKGAEEIESRLVEARRNMSQSERDAKSFYDSVSPDKPLGDTLIGMKPYSSLPQTHTSTRISKEMADAGKKPTPNKKPLREPFAGNVPTMTTPSGKPIRTVRDPIKYKPKITPEQQARNEFATRVFSNTDLHKDFKKRLARALGLDKDSESSVPELLANTDRNISAKNKSAIIAKFTELEKIANEYNALMKKQREGYKKNKTAGLNESDSKRANQLIDAYGFAERDLNGYVRAIQGKSSLGNRAANAAENLVGARNASILTSVGGVSRNITQELGANILETFLHPVKMAKASVRMPGEIARSAKKAAREFTVAPKTVSEVFPYAIGNTYRTLMSPVTGIANVRKIVARESIAEALLRAQGENPTRAEIKKFAGAMGADSEVVANNMMGILNGMTSHGKGLEVMRAYQEFIKTGSPEAKERFLNNTEKSSNLAAKLTQVAASSDNPSQRLGIALLNTIFPFVNTATNLTKTAVTYNLNPLSRSINDEILKAVRSDPANTLAILKNKAVTYGVLGGVYALYQEGIVGYNDGEDPAKPTGIYIHKGGDEYFPVRATPIEIPIAAVVTAAEVARDVAEGKTRSPAYYLGIMGNSLPYIDSASNLAGAAISAASVLDGKDITGGTGNNLYPVKAYGINTAKSFVPWSNNGITPAINSMQGKSTNAKTVYDKDMGTWFKQAVGASYPTGYRDKLKDSRDTAGRVRTVDQQGPFVINKTINDKNTAEFNDRVNDLLDYGRQNGLGKNVKDMFNTYDTGKNNNFKSIHDSITFLDAPEVDGKTTPDNTKTLEKNPKYADLSKQIRDAFYGGDAGALLTLDGKELYSDASVPNKNGTKNSSLPISMQSITNAIAATDLPKEQTDRMYEISQANNDLYAKMKAKEMTYDQYSAAKAENEKVYTEILSGSESFKKLSSLMGKLDESGFFKADGLGATRAGQTYLWNALNTLLASKGKTPAANYPETASKFSPYGGGGNGIGGNFKPGESGTKGIKWSPVGARQMAQTKKGTYKPFKATVRLGNAVTKDKTQNYASKSF